MALVDSKRWLGNLKANPLAVARAKADYFGTKAGFPGQSLGNDAIWPVWSVLAGVICIFSWSRSTGTDLPAAGSL